MNWKAIIGRGNGSTDTEVPLATEAVRLTDADTANRSTATTIDRPDGYTAYRQPLPVAFPDGDLERLSLVEQINRAIGNGCLDEFCGDARDAHIDARLGGWDVAVRTDGPDRLRVEMLLLAQELENLELARGALEEHREGCRDAGRRVRSWREILLGHTAVITPQMTAHAADTRGTTSPEPLQESRIQTLLDGIADALPWSRRPDAHAADGESPGMAHPPTDAQHDTAAGGSNGDNSSNGNDRSNGKVKGYTR